MLFISFIIKTKTKKYFISSFKVITTSKLNNIVVFDLAIFLALRYFWGQGPTRWGPRAEGRGTQTPDTKYDLFRFVL